MAGFTLENVVGLMQPNRGGAKGTFLLHVRNHELVLERRTMAPVGNGFICKITANEINNGLTASRWNHIDALLRKYNESHPS
jgi:hypothetical protein